MWIGGIRLVVYTKNSPNAGTSNTVRVRVLRNDNVVRGWPFPAMLLKDQERDDIQVFKWDEPRYFPRDHDRTPEPIPGLTEDPQPFPDYGFEFTDGLFGHLGLRLEIDGRDMWFMDNIDLDVKYIRWNGYGIDSFVWERDLYWTRVFSWRQDVRMSTDPSEGVATWTLSVPPLPEPIWPT